MHPEKTRVLRRGRQQEVTGVVVNDKPGVDRETLRRFRALLHQLEKSGPEGKKWNGSTDVIASAVGFANYVAMVDPAKGQGVPAEGPGAGAEVRSQDGDAAQAQAWRSARAARHGGRSVRARHRGSDSGRGSEVRGTPQHARALEEEVVEAL